MHWLCSAAILLGLLVILGVGLVSVLHDLMAVHDCREMDETARRTGKRATLPEARSDGFSSSARHTRLE